MADMNFQGGYWSPKNYLKVETGGSHDENPNGGVQIGVDQNGTPNMLEEGEPVYNDFVYSDNIVADLEFLLKYNLPKKYEGWLYSRIADDIFDEYSAMPLDPIEKNGADVMLSRLAECQEEQKRVAEEKELQEMMASLSPEEQEALGQMLMQAQQQPSPEEMAMAQQQPMVPQEQMAPPVEQPMPMEQPVMAACGGNIRRFDKGGFREDGIKEDNLVQRLWHTPLPLNPQTFPPAITLPGAFLNSYYNLRNNGKPTVGNIVSDSLDLASFADAPMPYGSILNSVVEGDTKDLAAQLAISLLLPGAGRKVGAKIKSGVKKLGIKAEKALAKSEASLARSRAAKQATLDIMDAQANKISDLTEQLATATETKEVKALKSQLEKAVEKYDINRSRALRQSARIPLKEIERNGALQDAMTWTGKKTSELLPQVIDEGARTGSKFWNSKVGKVAKTAIPLAATGAAIGGISKMANAYQQPVGAEPPAIPPTPAQADSAAVEVVAPEIQRDTAGMTVLPIYTPSYKGNRKYGGHVNRFSGGSYLDADEKPLYRPSGFNFNYTSGLTQNYKPHLLPVNTDNWLYPLVAGNVDDNTLEAENTLAAADRAFTNSEAYNSLLNGAAPSEPTASVSSQQYSSRPLSTAGRYIAPALEGLVGLYDIMTPADKYRVPTFQPYVPSGHMNLVDPRYVPVDINQTTNLVNNQMNATNRGLMNSGAGPSMQAALIAADNAGAANLGAARAQDRQMNEQLYNAALSGYNNNESARAQYYLGLDRYRQQALADAQRMNGQYDLMGQQLNYGAEGQKWQAVGNQIDNMTRAIAGIGQENMNMNMVNSNPAFIGYGVNPYGLINYLASIGALKGDENNSSCGGFIKKVKKVKK